MLTWVQVPTWHAGFTGPAPLIKPAPVTTYPVVSTVGERAVRDWGVGISEHHRPLSRGRWRSGCLLWALGEEELDCFSRLH